MQRSGALVLQQARGAAATVVPSKGRNYRPLSYVNGESQPARPHGGPVRRYLLCAAAIATLCVPEARAQTQAQAPAPAAKATDLDAFMAKALQRRDTDRKHLRDYGLDEGGGL